MKLAHLLSPEQIILDMEAGEHWASIQELVRALVDSGALADHLEEPILASLKAREELVSTGIGNGVAIPHTFSDELDKVVAIFGRSRQGIDFQSIDGEPVSLIILFIVPRKDYHMHLRTLAAIAKMFTNPEVRRQLLTVETRDEILAILGSKPSRVAAPSV
ncbi:MAG: PTS sugar transporter subunit IIA [Luteolibacter sp.]